jgi:hypothetical protein
VKERRETEGAADGGKTTYKHKGENGDKSTESVERI